MSESASKRPAELKFLNIMKSLPCLNAKINGWIQSYERMKQSSLLLGIGFWILELVLKAWWTMFMLLLLCLPSSILSSQPVLLLDDLICHQLEFIEQRLSKKAGTEFKTQNSLLERCFKVLLLAFRLLFLWPRILINLVVSTLQVICTEIVDDLILVTEVLFGTASQPRRTTTRVPKKRLLSSPNRRKRRREETAEGEVEQYLFVNESYQSENDPDYELGETTFDSEGSCNESATNDESLDAKDFLCRENREECERVEKCSEATDKNYNEDNKGNDEECDVGFAVGAEPDCDREDDATVSFGANIDAVEEITPPTTPPVEVDDFANIGGQNDEPEGSPLSRKG